MRIVQKSLLLFFSLLLLSGCSSPIWEVSVLNMTDKKIVLTDGKTRSQEIEPKRPRDKWTLKAGKTLIVKSGDEVLEEYTPEQLGLPADKDGKVLLIVGGPADLVLADYSDFYTVEGEEPAKEPKIKIVENLRDKTTTTAIERKDKIGWPHQSIAKTQFLSKNWKGRALRLVFVSKDISDEKIAEYLDYELKRQLQEAKSDAR